MDSNLLLTAPNSSWLDLWIVVVVVIDESAMALISRYSWSSIPILEPLLASYSYYHLVCVSSCILYAISSGSVDDSLLESWVLNSSRVGYSRTSGGGSLSNSS